jgi:nucleoside-diphosphate-sugar epimerase
MRVFVAGGSGTIGIPLVRALMAARLQVTALTRSVNKQDELQALGASVAVADALNREALIAAVRAARPTHVIHQLTALPKDGPLRRGDLGATNRLRIHGTRNLLEAAIDAGARRFLAGSFALLSPRGPVGAGPTDDVARAVRSMESQVLEATNRSSIDGVILRYGMFYGLEVPSTVAMIAMVRKRQLPVVRDDTGQLPLIHIEDAVRATVCALHGAPPGATYDIVDDRAVSMTEIVGPSPNTLGQRRRSECPPGCRGWSFRTWRA